MKINSNHTPREGEGDPPTLKVETRSKSCLYTSLIHRRHTASNQTQCKVLTSNDPREKFFGITSSTKEKEKDRDRDKIAKFQRATYKRGDLKQRYIAIGNDFSTIPDTNEVWCGSKARVRVGGLGMLRFERFVETGC